ncbi:carboxypeptidase Taq [Haloferax elongans ATCC BAA-1513]|uniref:Metal-dependent carboxypeptidase n=1 Tax=Haloferax elongans ATCC BAA-1513 TaxID=1230453 RepID=M0HUY6_HALEO|nr:carboxypeptidase M32 [Haloferax elongans]ELZ87543.1 carboxypeptidase Taq [Haloferax elongans ATCC BAA-1513]
MAQSSTEAESAYDQLLSKYKRIANVENAGGILSWDQQVMMPDEGTPARSQQMSALSALRHELLTDDEFGELLEAAEEDDPTEEQAAVLRELRRDYERAARVPNDLVEKISAASSEAIPAWKQAKAEDDFEKFAPHLEKHVELKRKYAEHIDPDRDAYEVLFEDYEPCLPLDQAEDILADVREVLVSMIEDIRESDTELAVDSFEGEFDESEQEELVRDALSTLGYPWDRGRLDTAPHPFSSGTQFDARVTTRYDESDPLGSLFSTIHEFGHALYTLGLPDEHYATPLGEDRNLSVHESQSRLWENHVGRSRAFWQHFLPTFTEHFPEVDASVEEAYEAANQVYDDNLIRVEADELTYHLHIVIRFELERELVSGDLEVEDVPEAWNDKYEEYLGIRPETDSEGCLQDIHWAYGNFGYFPTYSLGSIMAAQLFAAAEEDIDGLDEKIASGEFGDLREWLRENVHQHGRQYETNDLVKRATGEDFAADDFLDYVESKYSEIYDL